LDVSFKVYTDFLTLSYCPVLWDYIILHRLGLKTPVEYREFLEMKKENAA